MNRPHTSVAYAEHPFVERAAEVMPRGNTRTTLFVAPAPPYAVRGFDCWVEDQTGHTVLDCNNNYTALVHGHAPTRVVESAITQACKGTAFGLPTVHEITLAEHLAHRTGLPKWRFSNSGTEAVMTAIRAARAYTGRHLIVRFEGSYHGTYDAVVAKTAPGVSKAAATDNFALPQGDWASFNELMDRRGDEVAAVVIDLMPNRTGLMPADPDFVRHVRERTARAGALLHIDEVITFRLAQGGLHKPYDIAPDLITVGKVIGGGFPIGAVGGADAVMAVFDPLAANPVGWGGTFSANPISMVAGLTALEDFGTAEIDRLNELGERLRTGLMASGIKVSGMGSLVRIREDVDPAALWWELYGAGVLAGTNGLLALSTPMEEQHVDEVGRVVVASVRKLRAEIG